MAADEVAPTYMFPEGTFFSGFSNKGGLLAPYIYMPAAESYVFTTSENGSWEAGSVTATDASTFDAKYQFGYSSNPIPTVTIGGTSYSYGSGSTTAGSKVARVASSGYNLMTSAMAFASGNSGTQVSKIAGVTDYYIYMPNKTGQVMRVKGVSIPITTNNNGTDKTPTALFPDENAHICIQLFNASFTRNADWTTSKAKGSKELTPKYTATIADYTPNSDSKQYTGAINVEFEAPVDIVGPFVVVLSDFDTMGAETRLYVDKAQSNTVQYHKSGSFYKSTTGYFVSVDAMFPCVMKADATGEEFTIESAGGEKRLAFNTNLDPTSMDITVPEWVSYTISYESDKFYTNRKVYLDLSVSANTNINSREGTITLENNGMAIAYTIKQEAGLNVTLASSGYSTFSSTSSWAVPEGLEAWYASACDGNYVTLTKIADGKIPANTGVVLKGTASTTYILTPATDATSISGNFLVAATSAISALAPTTNGKTNYVLVGGEFCPFTGTATVPANKAYLSVAASAASLALQFDDATAISTVEKTIATGKTFNLNGQAVGNDYKGIVIINGKKVLMK